MMKLQFEQVLEYVEQGETDPGIRTHLQMQPDGPELLRQARLMNEMMKLRAEKGGFGDAWTGSESFGEAQSTSFEARETREPMQEMLFESAASYKRDDDRVSPNETKRLQDLASRAAGTVVDIGRLCLSFDGHRVTVSVETGNAESAGMTAKMLQRSAAHKDLMDENVAELRRREPKSKTIEVRGDGISVSVNARTTVDGTLDFRIVNQRLNAPARGLQLLFMPEAGPFVRMHTDVRGVARLAVPDRPGILRIESKQPQLLHIDIKK